MGRAPNVIVILADDLGYGDIGCDGGTIIRTPELDRMAAEGVRLTDFYASANVCTPSRAGLLTGQYAIRNGLAREVIQPADTNGLPPEAFTIPKGLRPEYATALVGKWHLGHVAPHWPPLLYGFDAFWGLPYSHDMRPLALYESASSGGPLTESRPDFAKLTELFFRRTLEFAEANRDRPFFVLLALTAPHVPLKPNPDDLSGSPAGAYGEVVEEIDRNVGRLLRRLEKLGLADNTLVIFTSDNGPWFEGSSGPFRDRKGGSAWDGGFRVPFIARWPGGLPQGRISHALASNLDLLPTLLALAGKPIPPDLDGRDIAGVLRAGAASPHEQIILFDNTDVAAVRTARWKYVVRSYYRTLDIPLDRYPLLFDMSLDPGETYSVASLHPEIAEDMRRRIERARTFYAPFLAARPPAPAPASAAAHPD